jgi:acyl-coenzyme A thioesterase PaaI-like protein
MLLSPSVGRVEFRAVPETRLLNLMGTVHGGWTMTMLDSMQPVAKRAGSKAILHGIR